MTPWFMIRNGSCRSTRRQMSDFVDDEVGARRRGRLERHIARCRRCARLLDSLRNTIAELQLLRQDTPPPLPSVLAGVEQRLAVDERQREAW